MSRWRGAGKEVREAVMENLEKLDPAQQKDIDSRKIFASVAISKSIIAVRIYEAFSSATLCRINGVTVIGVRLIADYL